MRKPKIDIIEVSLGCFKWRTTGKYCIESSNVFNNYADTIHGFCDAMKSIGVETQRKERSKTGIRVVFLYRFYSDNGVELDPWEYL